MPLVKVVAAGDKENLEAVKIGTKRWGVNGVKFGEAQNIPEGTQEVTVKASTGEGSGDFDFPAANGTLTVTLDGDNVTLTYTVGVQAILLE